MTLYEKIQVLCKKEGFEISNLGEHIPGLNVTKGSISKWKSGAVPRASTLKSIAEYFGVPVTYLTENHGDTIENQNITDNHGIIGHTHAPVTIINGSERNLSEQEVELLNIFEKLSVMEQAKLLVYANGLVGDK